MNLIEQLGGYERAKAFLSATSYTIDELIMMQRSGLRTQHVEKALLEYRRQHNIFEVGDKVVSDFYQLDSLFCVSHVCVLDEFIYSNKVLLDGDVFTTKDKLKGECRFLFEEIRHATDEEIKAGKRLEVNDGY